MEKKISTLDYNNSTVYEWFNNPFTDDFGSPDFHLPPITIDDRPRPQKISRYNPYLLPAAIYVVSENYVSNFNPPSDSPYILPYDDPNNLHVMKKYFTLQCRVNIGYCCRKHGQNRCYKKKRFYWSTCSDNSKKFYYCHGFSRISSETRTSFLEHQHSISHCFGWFLCLYTFHPLLYLLNSFCACFLPVPSINPCNITYAWSDWLFDLVLFLLTFWMHVITARPDR